MKLQVYRYILFYHIIQIHRIPKTFRISIVLYIPSLIRTRKRAFFLSRRHIYLHIDNSYRCKNAVSWTHSVNTRFDKRWKGEKRAPRSLNAREDTQNAKRWSRDHIPAAMFTSLPSRATRGTCSLRLRLPALLTR